MWVLSGIELIFFTAATMGLRLGFVLETMLIFRGALVTVTSAYTGSRPGYRLQVYENLGEDTTGTADSN